MVPEILFIFDYSSGIVFKHYLTDEESLCQGDEVFEEICERENIHSGDCNYMITTDDEIITI
jgi:hypothetical protein